MDFELEKLSNISRDGELEYSNDILLGHRLQRLSDEAEMILKKARHQETSESFLQNIRAEDTVNIEKKADESTESSMNEKDEIVDTDSSPERLQLIPTDDLIGRDLFLDEEETGEHNRARILKIIILHFTSH
jgi:hypothetical protein